MAVVLTKPSGATGAGGAEEEGSAEGLIAGQKSRSEMEALATIKCLSVSCHWGRERSGAEIMKINIRTTTLITAPTHLHGARPGPLCQVYHNILRFWNIEYLLC